MCSVVSSSAVIRLIEIRAVDRKKGCARRHHFSFVHKHCNNLALILRVDLYRSVPIKIDATNRGFLDLKITVSDRRDFDRRNLLVRQFNALG